MATIELTEENFETTITSNDVVVVDFWAEWCGPCKAFGPTFEAVSEAHPDVVFGKVDTDAQQALAATFQIRSIPTLMVFREQVVLFAQDGALPKKALEDILAKVQALDMDDVRAQMAAHAAAHEHGPDCDHDH